jgi:hypothetical protein
VLAASLLRIIGIKATLSIDILVMMKARPEGKLLESGKSLHLVGPDGHGIGQDSLY